MTKKEVAFVTQVWDFYRDNGRDTLPWRNTSDPYKILVSELMLQQTQVDRVVPKYNAFIKKWPTAVSLSKASLGDVLKMWQGLGYNRRAKYLHLCAKEVVDTYGGTFPDTETELRSLTGVGPYTAGALMAFAFNKPLPIIETNVRTVFIYHFFKNKDKVTDADILKKVGKTLPKDNPREWYAALMDYGTYLKKEVGNINKKSTAYTKQSKFTGSTREVRGAIMRVLTRREVLTVTELVSELCTFEKLVVRDQLKKLVADELVVKKNTKISLP